jgi:fructose transport system permease protein
MMVKIAIESTRITSGLSLAGVDDQFRVLAVGFLVIFAVAADQWIRKVRS